MGFLLLARLPVGVGVGPPPLNLGDPLSAVGVVDSVGSMGGRALTPRPRFSLDPPPRGSSSTCPTGMVGCAVRTCTVTVDICCVNP